MVSDFSIRNKNRLFDKSITNLGMARTAANDGSTLEETLSDIVAHLEGAKRSVKNEYHVEASAEIEEALQKCRQAQALAWTEHSDITNKHKQDFKDAREDILEIDAALEESI